MTNFFRYRPVISGFIGGPGINTWHGEQSSALPSDEDYEAFAEAVAAAYAAMSVIFAPGVSISFPGEVTEHLEDTGQLVGVHAITSPSPVAATGPGGGGAESRSTQIVAKLHTDVVRHGRRLQGRHFLGPINSFQLGSDGQVPVGIQTLITGAYGGVVDVVGPNLVVWGPPILEADGETVEDPGKKGVVSSVSVLTVPGTLRSRKV